MDSRNWNARQHGRPGDGRLRVSGEILAANPGVQAQLQIGKLEDADRLRLDLQLTQKPGFWPQVMTWMQVDHEQALAADPPDPGQVEIWYQGTLLATVVVNQRDRGTL